MHTGTPLIYQAVLFDGRRLGYADFLLRVEQPSDLGEWSYEVWDTKLAKHAKAFAVLQLCLYSEMVEKLQGRRSEKMHLVLGGVKRETISYRTADSSGPHHQDSGEAKIRESTAGVSRKPSSDCKACGCSSKHLCGLTAWNT